MSAATVAAIGYDPLRDSRHPRASAAREQRDWLLWLELGGTAARTVADYSRATDVALAMFPSKPFAEFTEGDLFHIAKRFSPGQRRVRMAAYASWFKWGYQSRKIAENPVHRLPGFKPPRQKIVETFSEPEVELLCQLPFPHGPLMTVLFESGIRKAEARNLKASHFRDEAHPDTPHGKLMVIAGKGDRDRVIPATARLAAAVRELVVLDNIGPRQHLWFSVNAGNGYRHVRRDKPVGDGTFHRWWEAQVTAAGVEYRKPHTTRHTFATRWKRAGLSIDEIQILLGHSSVTTTAGIYVHTTSDDVGRKMLEIISA